MKWKKSPFLKKMKILSLMGPGPVLKSCLQTDSDHFKNYLTPQIRDTLINRLNSKSKARKNLKLKTEEGKT
jgi:hypothetical protein